ncbi:hypothetical protein NECAME_10926 [Necator americanus]|uniref:Uncharacterized protein n=1 Tax=Necator americanus TaxID=51031 RepID=W2T8S2_NECAM|nr:hypothetical protein NECAME_10926 [Necator americanus]ETN77601.1 hypothetical protein NECAME_10926 [Necator americanus]
MGIAMIYDFERKFVTKDDIGSPDLECTEVPKPFYFSSAGTLQRLVCKASEFYSADNKVCQFKADAKKKTLTKCFNVMCNK